METQYNGNQAYNYHIEVKLDNVVIATLYWGNLPFKIYYRWFWYFKYRAALYQVKYPRAVVTSTYGMQKGNVNPHCKKKFLENKIVAAKRNITMYENRIKKFGESYNELFPMDEHDNFKELKRRLENSKKRLEDLKTEYKNTY